MDSDWYFIVADTEALNSARLARIKHDQAKSISKRAKPLGRKSSPSLHVMFKS
jgi:hypothetical protein